MAHYKRRSRRNVKIKYLACGCCVDKRYMKNFPPVEDAPSTGKSRKKVKPKKEPCRVTGKRHQYLTDIEPYYRWFIGSGEYVRKYKLCVQCGKDVTIKIMRVA